jgi:hypothetical protein
MWSAFVFILTVAVMLVLKLNLLTFFLIGAPVLIIMLIYCFFVYSFRDSLQPEPVPSWGYNLRLTALDTQVEVLGNHGFRKFDQFYLKMIPDSVTYAFRHNKEPIFFCLYHFGKKMACDVVTVFDNDFALTTSNVVESGATPRAPKDFVQIFPGVSYYELVMQHEKSHRFLIDKGLKPVAINDGEFRFHFMKSLRDQAAYIRKINFWPAVLLLGTVSRRGKMYCKSIIDQYSAGTIKIY